MNDMSARTSLAPPRLNTTNPEPDDLRARREIENAELLADLPMRTHATRGAWLAPRAHDAIALLAAFGHIRERNVRQLQEDFAELALHSRELELERGDLVAERARLRNQLVGILLCLLSPRDLLRRRVARRLLFIGALNERATIAIETFRAIETWSEGVELAASPHPLTQRFQIVPQQSQVVHGQDFGMPSRNERKPQFGSLRRRYQIVRGMCGGAASS